jgi:hypothetical protein
MATYDAITLEEAKGGLSLDGTAEDENIARLISGVTLELERRLGTQFVQRSLVERHEGGCKRIYPTRTPIISVTSIVDPAANTVPSTDYVIRQQRWLEHFGMFNHAFATSGQRTDWTITYTAGWFASASVITPDIKAEFIRALQGLRETPAAGVASVHVGDLSIAYAGAAVPNSPAMDAAVVALYAYRGVLL